MPAFSACPDEGAVPSPGRPDSPERRTVGKEKPMSRRLTQLALATMFGATLTACGDLETPLMAEVPAPSLAATAAQQNRILAEIRSATARFQRVEVALAEGYGPVSPCVESPMGGMGYHYRKDSLVDGVVDPSHPEMLLYEPQKNGKLELIGVEFVVPPAQWAGSGPPQLGDQTFGNDPFGNYALHVWVWRHNPNGMYADFNPRVSCAYAP
jgi:hypothetical protein